MGVGSECVMGGALCWALPHPGLCSLCGNSLGKQTLIQSLLHLEMHTWLQTLCNLQRVTSSSVKWMEKSKLLYLNLTVVVGVK